MTLLYLGALFVSFAGMATIDYRFRLALFRDVRRTVMTLLLGVIVFSVWDALGISLGIFFSGHSPYMSGWYLAPEYPIEELVFLAFLCYFTLVSYLLLETKWQRT